MCFPQVTNAERDGQRVFAVGDLLEPHPTDKNRWKVFGRVDDQIALSTGQKVRTPSIHPSSFTHYAIDQPSPLWYVPGRSSHCLLICC